MACSDELEERYQDPSRTETPTIDMFFTEMLDNNRVRPSYWEMSTFINWHIGVYTQSVGFLNSGSIYQQNESYVKDRWDDFYRPGANGSGVMAHFREIEKQYGKLSDDNKKEYEIFYQASKVILYDQASQMIDLWGDIPFSEAGLLNLSGETVYPRFDPAPDLYMSIIEDLKSISNYFSSVTLSDKTRSSFVTQDILLNGRTNKWQEYANSLRLRLLMRISFYDETTARSEILEMLQHPDENPVIDDADDGYQPHIDDVLLQPLTDYTENLRSAFSDWTNYPAPFHLLENVLKPADDPRIPVLFDKYGKTVGTNFIPNASYTALSLDKALIKQQQELSDHAIIDSSTYLFNSRLPGVIMTSSEVNFLKAEAFERWGGGDAGEAYNKAVVQSIDFYYYLNSLNDEIRQPLDKPDEAANYLFVEGTTSVRYSGTQAEKLSKIWTQKWVHYGFLQAVQSWSELRRTGHPQLSFMSSTLSGYELPPSRLTYPVNEKTYNENYADVAINDFRDAKIFWDVE
jgi:hypothetical protein